MARFQRPATRMKVFTTHYQQGAQYVIQILMVGGLWLLVGGCTPLM